MAYAQQLFSRSFWDAWDLVFNRSFASCMVGVAIFVSTLVFLRYRKKHEEARKLFKDVGFAFLATTGGFVVLFLLNVLIFTPHTLVKEADDKKSKAVQAQKKAEAALKDARSQQLVVIQKDPQLAAELNDEKTKRKTLENKLAEARKSLDPFGKPITSARFTVILYPNNKVEPQSRFVGDTCTVGLEHGTTILLGGESEDRVSDGKGRSKFVAECAYDSAYMGKPVASLVDGTYIEIVFSKSFATKGTELSGKVILAVNDLKAQFDIPFQTVSLVNDQGFVGIHVRDIQEELRREFTPPFLPTPDKGASPH